MACRLLALSSVEWPLEASRRVLVVVEDNALGELIVDALSDAGHSGALLPDGADLGTAFTERPYDAVIIDLDTRARNGSRLITVVRDAAPQTTVIALLPCGGLPPNHPRPPYHLAVEKPARLQALLAALAAAHVCQRN